jgi:transcriptional regulator with XRE-family HTH domain
VADEEEQLRTTLARLLRQLRSDAGITGVAAGERAGISQPMVSRWERGRNAPDPAQAQSYAAALGADPETQAEVARLASELDAVREQNIPSRLVLSRGAADFQRRVGRLEEGSQHIRTFTPTVVPGLLQTEDYARAVFGAGGLITGRDLDEAVEARMERQLLLRGDQRRFTLLISEGALRWMALSPEVMVRQLDRISEVAKLPHVSVGVIEWTTPSTVFPMHGWDLYDDRAAVVGTETATALITDRRDLEQYEKLFVDLATLASTGTELSRSLDRIRADYSALTRR